MPTFDKRARYPGGQTRIAIPTLSGGVGRQAPSKRAVNEAENIDNALVTLERSIEKRPPTNFIQRYEDALFTTLDTDPAITDSSLNLADLTDNADYGFFWFQISEEQRYLIAINYASTSSSDNYLQIFRVTKEGFYECSIDGTDAADVHAYLTYGNSSDTFREALSSITVGPQLLINNSNVYAGYTSKLHTFTAGETLDGAATTVGQTAWCKIGLDGNFLTDGAVPADYTEDTLGRKLVYFTTTPVDPEGQATIYVDGKFYIKNDEVFAELPAGTDLQNYLYRRQDVSGTLEFTEAENLTASHNSNPLEDTFRIDEESLPSSFEPFGVIELEVYDDDTATGASYVKFTFNNQEGRDKAAQFTKFYIGGNALIVSDAASTDNGVDEWYLTWLQTNYTSGSVEETRLTTVTTAVYDAFNAANSSSNAGAVPFSISYRFYGTYLETTTIPESLQHVVTDYAGSDFTLLDDVVVIFSCLNEGTSNTTLPATAIEAGTEAAHFTLRSDANGGALAQFIPVEDWRYPDSNRRYLGNKLADFSEFKFPPKSNETTLDNDGADAADYPNIDAEVAPWPEPWEIFNLPPVDMDGLVGETLEALYDDVPSGGTGKIYYVENSYAGEVPGFYIVKSVEDSPYVRLIRTPYEYSVLDADRFPKVFKIKEFDVNDKEVFSIVNMDLEERRSGNLNTNPGPEAFKEGAQRPIKSMAFFRDRLFLSAADTVFSSRTGDFSDFWVENPGIIADTDPIDIRLSTNKYAEVESMTPFSSSMFINTGSDIQFTLQGSENNITPFTAEISPTAFYSTSPLVDPVLLGSQIYFFAPQRAYVFFNDATVSINQAIEVSLTCPNYLPTTYGDVAVVPGYDSLCMVDDDNKKFVYMYTNRYRGAEVAQNAFFRYIFDSDIVGVSSYDNDIYYVSRYNFQQGDPYQYYVEYQKFYEDDHSIPRIDHQHSIGESDAAQYGSITYDSGTDKTTIIVKQYPNPNPDILYIDAAPQGEERGGESVIVTSGLEDDVVVSAGSLDGTLTIVLHGDWTTSGGYRRFIVGSSYNMSVELSPQFLRDQNQNVIEGVFSIRTLHLRHHNTGSYNVDKEIRGRRTRVMTYTPSELSESQVIDENSVPMPLYEKNGETFSKIMGFAAETNIFIESDYPNPVNIAQIELKGRFTSRTSGFVR